MATMALFCKLSVVLLFSLINFSMENVLKKDTETLPDVIAEGDPENCFTDNDCDAQRVCIDYHCAKACLWGDFVCRSNSKCIPKITRCDGVMDCDDNSDELNCQCIRRDNGFECTDGECIYDAFQCDGENDCKDGSDEKGCSFPA